MMRNNKKRFVVDDFNPKDYWLAGWSYAEQIEPSKTQKFKYEVSGIDKDGKEFFHKGIIEAESGQQARERIEIPRKRSGMRKIWCCIFVNKK